MMILLPKKRPSPAEIKQRIAVLTGSTLAPAVRLEDDTVIGGF